MYALHHAHKLLQYIVCDLREGVKKKNVFIWDFVPNIEPHPPTAHIWDSTKWEIKVKFILLFGLFGAFYFFEKMRNFSDKIPCICLGLWTPTHPRIACFGTFLDVCSKNDWMVVFTKEFGTLDPHLPIVWEKVPKNGFLTPSPTEDFMSRRLENIRMWRLLLKDLKLPPGKYI